MTKTVFPHVRYVYCLFVGNALQQIFLLDDVTTTLHAVLSLGADILNRKPVWYSLSQNVCNLCSRFAPFYALFPLLVHKIEQQFWLKSDFNISAVSEQRLFSYHCLSPFCDCRKHGRRRRRRDFRGKPTLFCVTIVPDCQIGNSTSVRSISRNSSSKFFQSDLMGTLVRNFQVILDLCLTIDQTPAAFGRAHCVVALVLRDLQREKNAVCCRLQNSSTLPHCFEEWLHSDSTDWLHPGCYPHLGCRERSVVKTGVVSDVNSF